MPTTGTCSDPSRTSRIRSRASTTRRASKADVHSWRPVPPGLHEPLAGTLRTSPVRRRIASVLLALCGVMAALLAAPGLASAHPLGNFTINRYAGIEVAGSDIYVRYALDVAEIPTYQLGSEIRKPGLSCRPRTRSGPDARRPARAASSRRAPCRHATRRRWAEDNPTRRRLSRARRGRRARVPGRSFPGRIGWREVTVSARDGGRVAASTVAAASASDALREYPSDLLRSPLDVSSAHATINLGSAPAAAPSIDAFVAPRSRAGWLRGAHRRGRSLGRCASPVAPDRRVLGSRACPHARPREGDGRGIPGGYEGDAATCVPPRRNGHDRAYRRRVRARIRDPRLVRIHRARAALPMAHARFGPARRPRRRIGATPASPLAQPSPSPRPRP